MTIGPCIAFFNIAVILSIVLNIFMEFYIPNNYMLAIYAFEVISLFQFVVNLHWKHVCETSARFLLDSLSGKQLTIFEESNKGNITEEEASSKKDEMQGKVDLICSIVDCSRFFSNINRIVTISLICVEMAFSVINGLGIYVMDKYIIIIIIYGIATQLIFLIVQFSIGRIIKNNLMN
jgi:flagellar biosynthesis protein FlhA